MDIVKKIKQVIGRWYLRYILATELYMVEPWERAIVHALFAVLFVAVWYFNYSIVLNGISQLRGMPSQVKEMDKIL